MRSRHVHTSARAGRHTHTSARSAEEARRAPYRNRGVAEGLAANGVARLRLGSRAARFEEEGEVQLILRGEEHEDRLGEHKAAERIARERETGGRENMPVR